MRYTTPCMSLDPHIYIYIYICDIHHRWEKAQGISSLITQGTFLVNVVNIPTISDHHQRTQTWRVWWNQAWVPLCLKPRQTTLVNHDVKVEQFFPQTSFSICLTRYGKKKRKKNSSHGRAGPDTRTRKYLLLLFSVCLRFASMLFFLFYYCKKD